MTKSKKKSSFVVYECRDEIIVTTAANEKKMLKDYFGGKDGRDTEEYDRSEGYDIALAIIPRLTIDL